MQLVKMAKTDPPISLGCVFAKKTESIAIAAPPSSVNFQGFLEGSPFSFLILTTE